MAQNIQLFGPRGGFLTHQWIISGAWHTCLCWNGMSALFGYHSNYDLQIHTKHPPPSMQLPGHQSITLSVAMTTQLWCHSVSAMACNACHAPEIFIIHTSANFEKSKTQIFSTKQFFFFKSINSLFQFTVLKVSMLFKIIILRNVWKIRRNLHLI